MKVDRPRDYYIKGSKSDRKRQISYNMTYMWNLKSDTNEPIYETESCTQRTDWQLPKGRRVWGRDGLRFGD